MRRQFTVPADSWARSVGQARRRLVRDLHDGVGPSLAAVALGLRAARRLMGTDPAAAQRLLARLEEETHSAIDDIRRLAADECPVVLARLGLVGALREYAAALSSRLGVRVQVEVPTPLPELPEEVSTAAYRIVREALKNVATHAEAGECAVRLSFDHELHIEIVDDGVGTPPADHGTGLSSMRQRAHDLGGTWLVEPRGEGGTRIAAALPVRA